MMKNFKKNQIVISMIALMLVMAGYLSYTNNQKENGDLLETSSLADSEEMASIGDATLVSANQATKDKLNQDAGNKGQNQAEISAENIENISSISTNESSNAETSSEISTQTAQEDSYFAQSRLDRDNMYSQTLENYQKILETDNLSSEEKTNAQTEIKNINQEKNAIMIAENLIKTKGFENVIIFVNNGNVSVIIKAEKLEEDQIAQIQNIITRELDVTVNKINVSQR